IEDVVERVWVHDQIRNTWEAHSDVVFEGWGLCSEESRGVRIRIADEGPRVQALGAGLDGMDGGMILNFTFANWSEGCADAAAREHCIRSIAVHEFGHALGFAHEQNRPDTPGDCVDQEQGTKGDVLIGAWDLASVMNYCNPEWNGNGSLSPTDIQGVRLTY